MKSNIIKHEKLHFLQKMQFFIFLMSSFNNTNFLTEYHTINHDLKYKHNNYTVLFRYNSNDTYGNIQAFLQEDTRIFAIIKIYKKSRFNLKNIFKTELNRAFDSFYRFYIQAHETENRALVHVNDIICKCIQMQLDDNIIITPCVCLLEHD
jgi:hypothetical protein